MDEGAGVGEAACAVVDGVRVFVVDAPLVDVGAPTGVGLVGAVGRAGAGAGVVVVVG